VALTVPSILDDVVCPTRQQLSDLSPLLACAHMDKGGIKGGGTNAWLAKKGGIRQMGSPLLWLAKKGGIWPFLPA
jgi:hypothetical protein